MEVLSWAIAAIGTWAVIIGVLVKYAKKDKKSVDKYIKLW